MWGGDTREGKTSNIELDVIYKAYLPEKRIVPSDTMVHLDWKRAQQLKAKVDRHGVVYFPIFIMKHWIAGLLEKGTRDSAEIQLSILDSAPSPIVEEKLRKHFKMVWPALRLVKRFSPRQERYSDDCGLYMSAVFFGDHLDIQIDHSHDMAKCMRRLLYAASKHHPPREYFLEKMRKILTNRPVSRKDFFYNEIEHKPWLKKTTANREDTFHLGGGERRATKSTNPKRDSRRANQPKARSPKPPPRQKKKEETVRTKMDRAERTKRTPQTPVPASKAPSRKRPERSAMDAPLPRRKAARKSDRRTPASSSGRSATGRNGDKTRSLNSSEFPSEDEDLPVIDLPLRKKNSVTRTPEHAPNDATVSSEDIIPTNASPHVQHGKCISEWTEITLLEANKHARKVYEAVLDHLWAATALARVGDGVAHGLTDTAVGQQRVRHKLTPLQPYSVQEMLKLLRKKIHMVDASPTDPNGVILREENRSEEVTLDSSIDELYLVRGPSLPTLYDVIKGYRFLLGACLREAPADMNGVRYPSHYVLTKDASEATVGVYVPATWTHYQSSKRQRAPRHASRYIPLPRSAASEAHQDPSDGQRPRLVKRKGWPGDGAGRDPLQEDEEDGATYRTPGNQKGDGYADVDANISAEAMRALESLRSNPLNMQGRPLSKNEEAEVCPRNWFLFAAKPPHISQLAWSLVRPDTRAHHLRWLTRIKSMNSEQMLMRFPAACIDLILSTARARKWKWATTAKAFAAVAGALRDLPLYSTQTRGIRLQDDPEWRSAFGTVQRYMKESVPDAPPFVSRPQVERISKRLRLGHPRAALFLAMMWGFAARACDISTLRAKDVTLFPGTSTDTYVKVTLTIRKGKGAKTRGPYPIPSVLTRDLAATQQEMLVQKKPSEELFSPHVEELRALIAQEVRTEMRGAQLPSIRKGALRCMAEAGVPLKDLMMISGHAKQATLLRYLGYGQQPTVEAETARDNARRALFQTL
ncbi:Phage_integrase_family (plasmid) [Leishmania braziliensis MHOM/BR/75/M2904]|uniref:Phage_integrase_family n=1 Tax=Leishmania braziliensis MHOM/BR/75/M2904 TaxID=420245 RepID=A0A3P3Z838_LEIBR|nr:Phage_integrase_family [Leishmania braziliensis MHOM/BR/75/M2904]